MGRLSVFIVVSVSGLLSLAACSPIKQGTLHSNGTAPASTSASLAARAPAMTNRIGPETLVFDTPLPADPGQAQVMKDFREGQILWVSSQTRHHLAAPVTDYVTGQALTHLEASITAAKAQDLVPAGTDRLFKIRITAVTGHNAIVSSCDDGSRYTAENRRTGQTIGFAPPGQAYTFETWQMIRQSGHWAVTTFSLVSLPDPHAKQCQP